MFVPIIFCVNQHTSSSKAGRHNTVLFFSVETPEKHNFCRLTPLLSIYFVCCCMLFNVVPLRVEKGGLHCWDAKIS